MAYIDRSAQGNRSAAIIAVIGVHAALGYAIVTGLASTIIEDITKPNPGVTNIPLPPPPPPEEIVEPEPAAPATSTPYVPPIEIDINRSDTNFEITPVLPEPEPLVLDPTPLPNVDPGPSPSVTTFDLVAAKPRNDPTRWLRDSDYRPSWVRQELVGTARFRLQIAANGAVTGCRITGSTGHSVLDEATCKLVTRRAKFQPARGSQGQPVPGSYSGAVRWHLPD